MSCCSHTPVYAGTLADVDQRCEACRHPMAEPPFTTHQFPHAPTQYAHDKESGVKSK